MKAVQANYGLDGLFLFIGGTMAAKKKVKKAAPKKESVATLKKRIAELEKELAYVTERKNLYKKYYPKK